MFKNLIIISIFFFSGVLFSQTMNIYTTNGAVTQYNLSDIDSITFTLQKNNFNLSGYMYDENNNPLRYARVRIGQKEDNIWVDSTYTDNNGFYTLLVDPGTYNVRGESITDTSYLSNKYESNNQVTISEEKVSFDIYVKNGLSLKLYNVSFNGGGALISVSPNSSINLTFNYQIWNPTGCSGCIEWLAVGIEHTPHDAKNLGIPSQYPGVSGEVNFILTSPSEIGSYNVYAIVTAVYTQEQAFNSYSNHWDPYWFIPIGTINVQ